MITSNYDLKFSVTDNNNGNYSVTYTAPKGETSNALQFIITYHGSPIKSSPFSVQLQSLNDTKSYDNWTLQMSSMYSGPQNTKEALLDAQNLKSGAGTQNTPNAYISVKYSQPMLVGSVELASAAGMEGGWAAGHLNGCLFQFLNQSNQWELIFPVAGVVESVIKKFNFTSPITSTSFRLYRENGFVATSLFRLRHC